MVNGRYLKQLEVDFEKEIKKIKNDCFDVDKINEISKKEVNLTKLISCSDNYYEDMIKIYTKNEKVIEVNDDLNLNVKGNGLLYIVVCNDSNLSLNFEDENFNAIYVKILVEKGVKLNLIEFSKSKYLWKNIEVILEKNSQMNIGQFIFDCIYNKTLVKLEKESEYDLKSAYFGNANTFYLNNSAIHLEEFSKSNLEINGAVINNSKVYCDGYVRIEQNAPKSEGYQKLQGLILDEKSGILSEPILEIKNNNVKCSHGSSISQIKDEIIFYMQSRGMTKKEAIELVINGYFGKVFNLLNGNQKEIFEEKVILASSK